MKRNIRAIIVDDESAQIETLKLRLIHEGISDVDVVAEAKKISEAVEKIKFYKPDLVFLDIDMSGNKDELGFDLFKDFDTIDFKVVFVTGYAEYALKAFQHNALGYLVKGADLGRLPKVIAECREQLELKTFFEEQQRAIHNLMRCQCDKRYEETIFVRLSLGHLDAIAKALLLKKTGNTVFIKRSEIVYLEADRLYMNIVLINGQTHRILYGLGKFEEEQLICPKHFLHINNSYVINMKHVRGIDRVDGMVIIENGKPNGKHISIGKEGKERLNSYLNNSNTCHFCA
jgi:two-component system, LytTR family, response regulator